MNIRFFHGTIRKKLILLILLATLPVFFVLLGFETHSRLQALESTKKDIAVILSGYSEVQQRISSSTRTLLRTVAAIPEVRQGNPQAARSILSTLLKTNPIYTNVILVDTKGNVVAAGKGNPKGLNFSDRKQFQDAINTGKFAAGEFVVGKHTKKTIFPFGMPVFDEQGKLTGAIIIGVNLKHYAKQVDRNNFPKGTFFGLCDHKGYRLFRYPYNEKIPIGKPIRSTVFNAASQAGVAGNLEAATTDGAKRFIAFEPIRLTPQSEPYMYMFMAFDKALIIKNANLALLQSAFIGLLSLSLALATAWFVGTRTIAQRFDKLTKAFKELGQGNTKVTSGVDYEDGEIGHLGKTFDDMVALLNQNERERTQVLEKLSQSESRFRTLFQSSPLPLWEEDLSETKAIIDTIKNQGISNLEEFFQQNPAELQRCIDAAKIVSVNKQALALYNAKDAEEFIANAPQIHTSQSKEQYNRHLVALTCNQTSFHSEAKLKKLTGETITVMAYMEVITDRTPNMDRVLVSIVDVTANKKFQEMIIQSEKMVSVGGLAAGMAHEINNPLGGILQGVQNIQRRIDPNLSPNQEAAKEHDCTVEGIQAYFKDRKIDRFLDGIRDSGERAAQIVSNMLDFSRKNDPCMIPADINHLVERSFDLAGKNYDIQTGKDFRKIQFNRELDALLPKIMCTQTEIEQVLLNLFSNSAQAMEGMPNPQLTVRTRSLGDSIQVEVEDNGPGIPDQMRQRVFEPFFTTKAPGEGTGLGLSVSYFIITQNHCGTFTVEPGENGGTKFIITLPQQPSAGGQLPMG